MSAHSQVKHHVDLRVLLRRVDKNCDCPETLSLLHAAGRQRRGKITALYGYQLIFHHHETYN